MEEDIYPEFEGWGKGARWLLAGLLLVSLVWFIKSQFSYVSWVSTPSKMTEARNTTVVIARGAEQYMEVYEHPLPLPNLRTDGDTSLDSGGKGTLIPLLLGMDSAGNPKRINFLGDLKDAVEAANGLIQTEDSAAIMDPWGRPYRILLDTNGDGLIQSPETGSPLHQKVLVWTAGKDGDFETWQDNAFSWSSRWQPPATTH